MLLQLLGICAQGRKDRREMFVPDLLKHLVFGTQLQLDQHLLFQVWVQL